MTHLLIELICLIVWATGFGLAYKAERPLLNSNSLLFWVKMSFYMFTITGLTYALNHRLEMVF